jgi:hypothetical protein
VKPATRVASVLALEIAALACLGAAVATALTGHEGWTVAYGFLAWAAVLQRHVLPRRAADAKARGR